MNDDLTSHGVKSVRTRVLPSEPETVFLTFETATGEEITFHLPTGYIATLAAQMAKDARGLTQ